MSWRRISVYVLALAATLAAAVYAVWPSPLEVETAAVVRGRFEQTVDEDGKTRARERYTVAAPVAGMLLRIRLKAGDAVEPGAVLASIMPSPAPMLDPRTRQELEQRLGAAEAGKMRTAAALERARFAADQARSDVERTRALAARGVAAASRLEHDELALNLALKELDAAGFEDHAAGHEVELALAALSRLQSPGPDSERWDIRSPVAGRVLRVIRESESPVVPGSELLEIADPADLEIVVDVLTTQAVEIRPGAAVFLDVANRALPLRGVVRRIEPSAFTKVSALGVEEQRVNVIIDFASPREDWAMLGDAFRVDVRIVVFALDDATKVPASALFRTGNDWAVFIVAGGIARLRTIGLLRRGAREAAVERGLSAGDMVVSYPGDALVDGARVRPRPAR